MVAVTGLYLLLLLVCLAGLGGGLFGARLLAEPSENKQATDRAWRVLGVERVNG